MHNFDAGVSLVPSLVGPRRPSPRDAPSQPTACETQSILPLLNSGTCAADGARIAASSLSTLARVVAKSCSPPPPATARRLAPASPAQRDPSLRGHPRASARRSTRSRRLFRAPAPRCNARAHPAGCRPAGVFPRHRLLLGLPRHAHPTWLHCTVLSALKCAAGRQARATPSPRWRHKGRRGCPPNANSTGRLPLQGGVFSRWAGAGEQARSKLAGNQLELRRGGWRLEGSAPILLAD